MNGPFCSLRLVYRAVEDNAQDDAFMHSIQADAHAYANSNSSLLKPESRKESSKHRCYVAEETMLGVIVCLAPPSPLLPTPPIPIGSIHLTKPSPGTEHHRNSYIGVDIIAQYQRQGYGSEAIEWVLEWGFQMAGLHRIGIESYSWNDGAGRLYERLGFILEGRKREALWYSGGWHDVLCFSILEGEWRARRSKGLVGGLRTGSA